jgi:hypothetical protein
MARRRKRSRRSKDWLLPKVTAVGEPDPSSLLDVIDHVLNKGAVIKGDLALGVANVDLIYVELSALLAAIDRVRGDKDTRRKK